MGAHATRLQRSCCAGWERGVVLARSQRRARGSARETWSCLEVVEAAGYIAQWAGEHISDEERLHFIEIAETELLSIHDGNFARYQIRPAEFVAWKAMWRKKPTIVEKVSPAPQPKRPPKR